MPYNKRQFRKELWATLFESQEGRCIYCRREMRHEVSNHPLSASLDHIIPQSQRGKTDPRNLILACRVCNMDKSSQNVWDWWRGQDFYDGIQEMILRYYIRNPDPDVLNFLLINYHLASTFLSSEPGRKCLDGWSG